MALIVEDGSIVAGADSYISRVDVIAYAAKRGVTLADDDTTDQKVIKAMDYLAYYDGRWKGEQVEPDVQSLAWPRKYAYIGSGYSPFPDDQIPANLVKATAELTMHVNAGVNLLPTVSGDTAFVTREKVDVIETEYSEAVALAVMGSLPTMPLVESLLSGLLNYGSGLRTVRI